MNLPIIKPPAGSKQVTFWALVTAGVYCMAVSIFTGSVLIYFSSHSVVNALVPEAVGFGFAGFVLLMCASLSSL